MLPFPGAAPKCPRKKLVGEPPEMSRSKGPLAFKWPPKALIFNPCVCVSFSRVALVRRVLKGNRKEQPNLLILFFWGGSDGPLKKKGEPPIEDSPGSGRHKAAIARCLHHHIKGLQSKRPLSGQSA